jgi:uroporphyrinogen decarboxylase
MTTPRDDFITALNLGVPSGRVPHFELVFFLTMEAFGRVHPSHRYYGQWNQMEEQERELHRNDMADLHIATAERFQHSAIFLHPNPGSVEETIRLVDRFGKKPVTATSSRATEMPPSACPMGPRWSISPIASPTTGQG